MEELEEYYNEKYGDDNYMPKFAELSPSAKQGLEKSLSFNLWKLRKVREEFKGAIKKTAFVKFLKWILYK